MTSYITANLRQFFNPRIPNTPQPQQQSNFFSRFLTGTRRLIYTPVRQTTEEAAQGFAERFSNLFNENQDEITNRVRDVFTQALLRRCPEHYHQLREVIRSFLNAPSQDDLNNIQQLLDSLQEAEIRALAPTISDLGIQELTTLRAFLDDQNHEQLIEESPVLTVSDIVKNKLQTVEELLCFIIENHEGALIHTLDFLTQSMNDQNGPINTLRRQLNHPQQGIIAETLTSLRRDLNARVHPSLRQIKESFEAYRNALDRNANQDALFSALQTLHEKLQLLRTQREYIPQIIPDQWEQLGQFDRELEEILRNRETFPSYGELLQQSEASFQIITTVFNVQRGIVEEATDILVEGISRGVEHLALLPSRMYQNFLSPQIPAPVQQTPASTTQIPQPVAIASNGDASEVVEESNFLNLNNIAIQGRRFLESMLSSASGALSQQGARALATLVRYVFEKIREHIQQTPEQSHLLTTIDPMLQRLQGAVENSSWRELTEVLQSAFQFIQEQQVYLQGLRLPLNPVRTNISAIPDFLQNINAYQNALQPFSQRTPQTISGKEISLEATLFINRVSFLGPTQFVLEKICQIEPQEVTSIYKQICKTSDLSQEDANSIFRKHLFKFIDQANLSNIIKPLAKGVYDFIFPLSFFYVNSMFNNVFNFVKNGIKDTPSSQESKEEFLIKLARNWLAVMSGAYNQVAFTPPNQAKDFHLMMEEAITSPGRNGGLNQHELFAAVAKTAIDTFGPQIKWDKTIDQYFNVQIPMDSPLHFLDPLAKGLNYFCNFCLKVIIFVPQSIGNLILQGSAKIALNNSPLLQDYANQTIELLRRNTPTSYATQRLIYQQLQKILQLLQQKLNDETNETGLHSRDTNIKRVEITNLVGYLMEVLNKSQHRTQDQLHNYLRRRGPLRDEAGRELEDTFIPEITEDLVKIFSVSLKTMTQENEMQQMVYDALRIANNSFEDRGPVSDEDFAAVEKGIQELIDQILETAIFHIIDKKLDFTNEKQKCAVTNFINQMKEQSQIFATQMSQKIQEIPYDTINASDLALKISQIIKCSTEYNYDRVDALGQADGNRNLHTETKYYLNQLSRNLLNYCNANTDHLTRIKNIADELVFYDKLLPPLLLNSQINQTLNTRLQNPRLSSEDLTFCKTQVFLLQQYFTTLQSYQCPLPITNEIQRSCQEYNAMIQGIEELQKTERILHAAFLLFTQLKQEKLSANSTPNLLRQLEEKLCSLLNTLPINEQKNQLNQQVLALILAQNNEAIENAASCFFSLHVQFNSRNFAEENTKLESLRRVNTVLQPHFDNAVGEFSHQTHINRSAIQHLCSELTRQVQDLDQCAQAQHDLPIWNLFAFDMQWVTETVKNLAFDRAKSKIKQLVNSLYQRSNYLGFTNQVVLLPFLEKFGRHHLRD